MQKFPCQSYLSQRRLRAGANVFIGFSYNWNANAHWQFLVFNLNYDIIVSRIKRILSLIILIHIKPRYIFFAAPQLPFWIYCYCWLGSCVFCLCCCCSCCCAGFGLLLGDSMLRLYFGVHLLNAWRRPFGKALEARAWASPSRQAPWQAPSGKPGPESGSGGNTPLPSARGHSEVGLPGAASRSLS